MEQIILTDDKSHFTDCVTFAKEFSQKQEKSQNMHIFSLSPASSLTRWFTQKQLNLGGYSKKNKAV